MERQETNELLEQLGFEFDLNGQLKDRLDQRAKFQDLLVLMANFAQWMMRDGDDAPDLEYLIESAEEWLVG